MPLSAAYQEFITQLQNKISAWKKAGDLTNELITNFFVNPKLAYPTSAQQKLINNLRNSDAEIKRLTTIVLCLTVLEELEINGFKGYTELFLASVIEPSKKFWGNLSYFNYALGDKYKSYLLTALDNSKFESFCFHCLHMGELSANKFDVLCNSLMKMPLKKLNVTWNELDTWSTSHIEALSCVIRTSELSELDIGNNNLIMHHAHLNSLFSAIAISPITKLCLFKTNFGKFDLDTLQMVTNLLMKSKVHTLDLTYCELLHWTSEHFKVIAPFFAKVESLDVSGNNLFSLDYARAKLFYSCFAKANIKTLKIHQDENDAPFNLKHAEFVLHAVQNNPGFTQINGIEGLKYDYRSRQHPAIIKIFETLSSNGAFNSPDDDNDEVRSISFSRS